MTRAEIDARAQALLRDHGLLNMAVDPVRLASALGVKVFNAKFGGFVDPSCLMIDKLRCDDVIRWWGIPLKGDAVAMSADRHVFHWLNASQPGAGSDRATTFYVMNEGDGLHRMRMARLGTRYEEAGRAEP